MIWGWGVAQWPYLLPETLKVSAGAAPDATLWTVLIVFGIAAVVILPSLGLLYYLDQRSLLDPRNRLDVAVGLTKSEHHERGCSAGTNLENRVLVNTPTARRGPGSCSSR